MNRPPVCRVFPDCSCSGPCEQDKRQQEFAEERAAIAAAVAEVRQWPVERRAAFRAALRLTDRAST